MNRALLLLLPLLASCTLTAPVAVTDADINTCPLTGEASSVIILGVFLRGDASIGAAARAGGIAHVCTVDVRRTAVLGRVFVRETTIVTGKALPSAVERNP